MQIKRALIDLGKPQIWLILEIRKKTGKYFDTSYMSKIMTGKSNNKGMKKAICEILHITEDLDNG